jgi:predicted N-acetyltransferase YhbS
VIISTKSQSNLVSLIAIVLELIATIEEYKGRGAGSLMMRYGCDMADKDELETYVDASEEGYPMYLKYGFILKREEVMPDASGYIQRHLVRSAKKQLEE